MKIITNLSRQFSKPVPVAKHFKSIKSKFGDIGEMVYQEPGMRLYKIANSDDLLQIGIVNESKYIGENFVVRRLVPSTCSYKDFLKKIGSVCTIYKKQFANTSDKEFHTCRIKKLTPELFANQFDKGSSGPQAALNHKIQVLGESYFSPVYYIGESKMIYKK